MKGSTWHRWDLHYHTQSSDDYKQKDKSNQNLIDELIADNVSAVVVSDHHRIDFQRINELNQLALGKIVFFRGIEITSELGGNESVHFIAIFPDNLRDDEIRDGFLAPLEITEEKTSRDSSLYHCAISYQDFLNKAKSLGAIISVHAGKKSNSIENIHNWCRTKQDFKKRLLEQVDILETSKKEDIKVYKDLIFKNIGKECPIVVCSDYHSEFGYREYMNNSTNPPIKDKRDATWIKSDLTFEGLKQIIFEPNLRVRIQENDPSTEKFGLKIETLKIEKSKLFNQSEIKFNEDMIAVIGEKGSGKTALLDMVAHILGSQQDDSSSFIKRAKSELKNCAISYNVVGDAVQTVSFNDAIPTCRCKYINPVKLSSFCEDESEMQNFIKSILIHEEIAKENSLIVERNLEIQSIILKIDTLDSQIGVRDQLLKSMLDLEGKIQIEEKNKPELPTVDGSIREQFLKLGEEIEKDIKELEKLQSSFARLHSFNVNKDSLLKDSVEEIREILFDAISKDINFDDFKISASYDEDTIKKLSETESEIYKKKERLKKKVEKEKAEYEGIKSTVFKNEELQARYEKWQKYILELREELKKLKLKDAELEVAIKDRNELFDKCINLFCDNVIGKQHIFKYYNDLKDALSRQIGNVEKNKITFNPVVKIDKVRLFEGLERIISLKSINEETLKANIDIKYQKQYEKVIATEENLKDHVASVIDLIINFEGKKNIYGKNLESKAFKIGHRLIDLYKIAFSDFLDINYDISFNGIPMDQLSSGQKGIVLLKLLLRLDNSTDPLLIDQPEDNLDNKSVYDQLVEEFKLIKQKRQLIIATHNPNLVINTDAEQIIVAEYRKGAKDGFITYVSGSIENSDIRERICKILEGGKDAFINREKRYHFNV